MAVLSLIVLFTVSRQAYREGKFLLNSDHPLKENLKYVGLLYPCSSPKCRRIVVFGAVDLIVL